MALRRRNSKWMVRWASFLALLGLALPLASCGGKSPEIAKPNVVLILVDALRADHLGCYGYDLPTSPHLDAFAAHSVRFSDVLAQSNCTFPSANSILTGRWPSFFANEPPDEMASPPGTVWLAQVLKDHGYSTAAVSASPVVRNKPSKFNPWGGYGRGFDHFLEDCMQGPASCVNGDAFAILPKLKPPFFLYLHYMDTHDHYTPPARWRRGFVSPACQGLDWVADGDPNPISYSLYRLHKKPNVTPRQLGYLEGLYDSAIAYWDSEFEQLLERLKQRGVYDNTMIIVLADHGEEFLEHGDIKHCHNLFDTTLKTPLIVHLPGQTAGQVISTPTQNLDVMPTILDEVGATSAAADLPGHSLRPLIEQGRPVDGPIFGFWGVYRSDRHGRYKLIANLAKQTFSLYDLASDPGETHDVLSAHPIVYRRMRKELLTWLAKTEGNLVPGEHAKLGQRIIKRLKSLGYLQ